MGAGGKEGTRGKRMGGMALCTMEGLLRRFAGAGFRDKVIGEAEFLDFCWCCGIFFSTTCSILDIALVLLR